MQRNMDTIGKAEEMMREGRKKEDGRHLTQEGTAGAQRKDGTSTASVGTAEKAITPKGTADLEEVSVATLAVAKDIKQRHAKYTRIQTAMTP